MSVSIEQEARESRRLEAVRKLNILDTPAEGRYDRITRLTRRHFGVEGTLISIVDSQRLWFKSSSGLIPRSQSTTRFQSMCSQALSHEEDVLVIPDAQEDPLHRNHPMVQGPPYIRFYAGRVCRFQGEPVATLCLIDQHPRTLEPASIQDLDDLGVWVENEMAHRRVSEAQKQLLQEMDQLREQALTDHLTRAWNRLGLEQIFERELAQARRQCEPLSVIMADIDHFKQVNDTYGHDVGDIVLRRVADRIRLSLRPYDTLARMGGEEFFIILPGVEHEQAGLIAERIRAKIAEWPIEASPHPSISVTVSLGAAAFLPSKHPDLCLAGAAKAADANLYLAKAQGRNRVVLTALAHAPEFP